MSPPCSSIVTSPTAQANQLSSLAEWKQHARVYASIVMQALRTMPVVPRVPSRQAQYLLPAYYAPDYYVYASIVMRTPLTTYYLHCAY